LITHGFSRFYEYSYVYHSPWAINRAGPLCAIAVANHLKEPEMGLAINSNQLSLALSGTPSTKTPASFAEELAATIAAHKANFMSGRIGLDLDQRGQPAKVIYFDKTGRAVSSSAFNSRMILKHTQKHGINLQDLRGLGAQLDAACVCYRPYELYDDSGSSEGVDFDDLIAAASFSLNIGFRPMSH
jgi:hypothetical protein